MDNTLIPIESEQAVLGGIFLSPKFFAEASEWVSPASFGQYAHRLIFQAMRDLVASKTPIDLVTVAERLESQGHCPDPIDLSYLYLLARETPSSANTVPYAIVVNCYARRRALVQLGQNLSQWALTTRDVEAILSQLKAGVDALDTVPVKHGPQPLKSLLPDVLDAMQQRAARADEAITGLSIGLPDLDRRLDGLCPGRLYVLAGRPSHGKSVLGLQTLRHAIQANRHGLLFTLEMPAGEVIQRLLAAEQPLDYARVQAAKLTDREWVALTDTATRLQAARLWIDDSSALSVDGLLSRARRLHRTHPLGLVVVDYLGLMTGEKSDRRDLEVGSITRALKELAKELSVPVVLLAQLNRKLEDRPNRRPMMSDLRESGAIEQDADVVIFIYRDELYSPDSPDVGCAEIIIGKNRAGKTGMVPTAFLGEHCTIHPLAGPLPSSTMAPPSAQTRRSRGVDL